MQKKIVAFYFFLLFLLIFSLGGCELKNTLISSLIFFPVSEFWTSPEDFNLEAETVKLITPEKVELFSWYLPAQAEKGVLLYIHGNAGNISHRLFIAKEWVSLGFSCFLLDYRGFGKSQGRIKNEQDLYEDVLAAYRWLREEKAVSAGKIILYGESVGCAGSIELASKEKVGALILMAPFTRLLELARFHYGLWVPKFLLNDYLFDNESKIEKIKAPIFIMQGTSDEIVPVKMGRRLFEKAPEPKEAYWVEGGRHNDLPEVAGQEFWARPARFLNRYLS